VKGGRRKTERKEGREGRRMGGGKGRKKIREKEGDKGEKMRGRKGRHCN
jgi:hypothetical protein